MRRRGRDDLLGIESVIVARATGADVAMQDGRDVWYDAVAATVPAGCVPEPMSAEHPLFILYTSGSTGKLKGVVHTSGGYLVWAALTHATVFDYRAPDVYWCAGDVGWVTGHSYIVYGPVANVAMTLVYEGDTYVTATSCVSLRLLGSVGESINPEAWRWYHDVVGEGRCPVMDTWWQTETGGHMITPTQGMNLKPGSATLPFYGIEPKLFDADGRELDGEAEGNLVIARSWPGQMRGVWGDEQRHFETYFRTSPGVYTTVAGARRDAEGYYWIIGRVDDVINVSGHRMGTAEVESALVLHHAVAEAAVVGMPHDVKGQGIYAYVTLNAGVDADDALAKALRDWVRHEISPIATPDAIQFAPGLPKTRSGKIMRRIVRKIAENETSSLGDISTLADPSVVDDLVTNRVG